MSNNQPTALRIAKALGDLEVTAYGMKVCDAAAAELRRLHEANQELLTELKKFTNAMTACMDWPDTTSSMVNLAKIAESARTIIAKVEGQ